MNQAQPMEPLIKSLGAEPMAPNVGVIALVPDRWDSPWTARQQILRRLARYFQVVWIDPAGDWRAYWSPTGARTLERTRFHAIAPGFSVMTPGCTAPRFYRPRWLRRHVFSKTLGGARAYLRRLGATQIMLYLWRDEFVEALELVRHDASCYHIDDDYSFSDFDVPNQPREVGLIRAVDQVIVHSHRLLEKKGGINPHTMLIPNGVDYESFTAGWHEPADLAAVPKPRIGYLGFVKKQLDLELLVRLAQARGDWSFVLVGPLGNIGAKEALVAQLRQLQNVNFLGCKPVDDLAAYAQHMDVCLMCYEVSDYTNSIYPLKLHEYLAAGRPIVSAPITEVIPYADVLTLARNDAEWLNGIAQALRPEASAATEVERRRKCAQPFDWNSLVAQVAQLFGQRLGLNWRDEKGPESVPALACAAPMDIVAPLRRDPSSQ
jgi:glycosyltransferase involved in cell wall biosynthesis